MAKVKFTVALDESKLPALERFAESLGLTLSTAAAALLSRGLADPDGVFSTASRRQPAPAHASVDQRGEATSLSAANGFPAPAGAGVDQPALVPAGVDQRGEADIFSSSLPLPPEKKKRKKTESPSEGAEEFARGWKGYAELGGRLGSKAKAVESWNGLLATWPPEEIRRRWATFAKLTPAKFLPEVHRLLRPSEGKLTDEALKSLEVRRRNEVRTDPEAIGAFDSDAYEERIARARRAADPIPRPSAGATRPARAGGLPDAPQAPSPVAP